MRKYYIRAAAFGYNDEYMYPIKGFGRIKGSYDNKEEALLELKKLNRRDLSRIRPEDHEPISYCHKNKNEEAENLDQYLQTNFGVKFLVPVDYTDDLVPDRNYSFPDLTIDQAWEIRKISGIRFHEIIEISDDGKSFMGIRIGKNATNPGEWATTSAMKYSEETGVLTKDIPLIYNSKEDAINNINSYQILAKINDGNGIEGTLEALSETPAMLEKFIKGNRNVNYDPATKILTAPYLESQDFIILNGLLKESLFEILPISMAEVEAIGDGWQPEM